MKVLSFQEKKKKRIQENLHLFQERFWEWVLTRRWNPCDACAKLLLNMWEEKQLWEGLCGVCSSYFYYYQVLYVRALKTVCQRGEKLPTFEELEEWYFNQEEV